MGKLIAEIISSVVHIVFIYIASQLLEALQVFAYLYLLICGPGYLIGRHVFRRKLLELEDFWSFALGLLFWAIITYFIWKEWPWLIASVKL